MFLQRSHSTNAMWGEIWLSENTSMRQRESICTQVRQNRLKFLSFASFVQAFLTCWTKQKREETDWVSNLKPRVNKTEKILVSFRRAFYCQSFWASACVYTFDFFYSLKFQDFSRIFHDLTSVCRIGSKTHQTSLQINRLNITDY